MCGIAGIGGNFSSSTISEALARMNDSMIHRGPDSEGLWSEDGFGFAMRRLSIIDLSSGNQPMWDKKRGLGLVYNGETYNYKELRSDLKARGEEFHTSSDTEVVLKSFAAYGEKALNKLNGMYGAALWNTHSHCLLLFRDRLGIKPLYYYWDGKTLVFASEIKAILASGLVKTGLNEQAIWDYLTLRYIPEPTTAWEKIHKLPPGHLLRWSPSMHSPEILAYWELGTNYQNEKCDLKTAQIEFEELFLDSVEKRLVASDVPVGVLLSGGLDSSAVAAAAMELGHCNFHTFSVAFEDGGEFSELPYAKALAGHIGSKHHELVIGKNDFMTLLPEMVYATDEPLADLASIPLLAISRLAKKHVKVVLSGEGSDEVLGGYNFESRVQTWDRIRKLQTIPKPLQNMVTRIVKMLPGDKAESLMRAFSIPLEQWNNHFPPHMTNHWSEKEKKRLWPSFQGKETMRIIRALYRDAPSSTPLDQMLFAYQRDWMVEDLLMKADKMTMFASLELRVPFLDYRLVEWAARQHQSVKIGPFNGRRYVTKNILRRFAHKRLPKSIIDRPKQGFPVPAYDWLARPDFQDIVREKTNLTSDSLLSFNSTLLNEKFTLAGMGNLKAAHEIWLTVVLGVWLDIYKRYF